MIPARGTRFTISAVFAASLVFASAPARADVMEVGPEGARWVTGDLASMPVEAAAPVEGVFIELSADAVADAVPDAVPDAYPEGAIANVAAHAAGVPTRYAAKIMELSRRFDLSPSLLEALVWQESRWREGAVSHAGARGLAQLMPGTARYLGVDSDDPMDNLEGGARYLREQLDRFDGDLEKALAAYNAGPGRVIRAGGVPNIKETKAYVAAIMGRLSGHARINTAP